MMPISQLDYITASARIFEIGLTDREVKVIGWVEKYLVNRKDHKIDEEEAKAILPDFRRLSINATSQKRYRAPVRASEEIFHIIFERSFQNMPSAHIQHAEKLAATQFYSTGRQICWITIPQMLGDVTGNGIFKLAVAIATFAAMVWSGMALYEVTRELAVAKGIPFLINHAPIEIIQVGNQLAAVKDWVFENPWKILFWGWVVQYTILTLPEIPYVTRIVGSISFWAIFGAIVRSPQTAFGFALGAALDAGKFGWGLSSEVSQLLQKVAQKEDNIRLALCKAKAYQVWRQTLLA